MQPAGDWQESIVQSTPSSHRRPGPPTHVPPPARILGRAHLPIVAGGTVRGGGPSLGARVGAANQRRILWIGRPRSVERPVDPAARPAPQTVRADQPFTAF